MLRKEVQSMRGSPIDQESSTIGDIRKQGSMTLKKVAIAHLTSMLITLVVTAVVTRRTTRISITTVPIFKLNQKQTPIIRVPRENANAVGLISNLAVNVHNGT